MKHEIEISNRLLSIHESFEKERTSIEITPVIIEDYFSTKTGQIKGQSIQMTTRRWSGSLFESMTEAIIRDSKNRLISVTISIIPHHSLPILGLDYVGFRGTLNLVALDLYPMNQDFWQENYSQFLIRQKSQSESLVQRKIPEFANTTFSSEAIFCAATTEAQLNLAEILADKYLSFYFQNINKAEQKQESPEDAKVIKRWKALMLENKKEHSALSRLFGEDFASSYLNDFLFA